MDSAPRDGGTIEVLVDNRWVKAYWSDEAQDGSPQGTEGWAALETDDLIPDPTQWRHWEQLDYGQPSALPGHSFRQPIVVLGLGFGDEAKGATVDFLSSRISDASAVVRWSGGANAAHNVRHGHRHHCFRLFGSGSFLGLPTYLTEKVVLNLQVLMGEAVALEAIGVHSPLSLLVVNGDSLVTTPIHMALNRAREILRGIGRHGSTGLGIAETVVHGYAERMGLTITETVGNFELQGPTANGEGILTAGALKQIAYEDLPNKVEMILKQQARYADPLIMEAAAAVPELAEELWYGSLSAMAEELIEIAESLEILESARFKSKLIKTMAMGTVIFEGSQGILLDEQWGFHPHTTWARTEPSELFDWLQNLGHRPYALGLTRSFMTRHGAGPLPSESVRRIEPEELPEDDNSWGRWQGVFRNAPLDLPLLNYSRRILAEYGIYLDGISISHLDGFGSESIPVVRGYDGSEDPSRLWHFKSDGATDFPTVNSDVFLEQSMLNASGNLGNYSAAKLPELIGSVLEAPAVILSSGPSRSDRKFVALPGKVA